MSEPPAKRATRRPAPVARFRLRVMSGEVISIGPGKIALLEAIDQTRSITAAAKAMGMSYRRAWMLVDQVNASLATPAVASTTGGERGGSSALTEVGTELVALYRRIEARAAKAAASDIERLLKLLAR
jgi:molybdate transport system regulatory protein